MHPLLVQKIRVLGLLGLSFMLAAGFICILSASSKGNWGIFFTAFLSVSIALPGRIGYLIMMRNNYSGRIIPVDTSSISRKCPSRKIASFTSPELQVFSYSNPKLKGGYYQDNLTDRNGSLPKSCRTRRHIMIPGLDSLCLLFTPLEHLSEWDRTVWLGAQIFSLSFMVLALAFPVFLFFISPTVSKVSVFFSLLGAALMMGSIFMYSHFYHKDEDDYISLLGDDTSDYSSEDEDNVEEQEQLVSTSGISGL